MLALGRMHEQGKGMPASKTAAADWYQKAAAAGDDDVKTQAQAALNRLTAAASKQPALFGQCKGRLKTKRGFRRPLCFGWVADLGFRLPVRL